MGRLNLTARVATGQVCQIGKTRQSLIYNCYVRCIGSMLHQLTVQASVDFRLTYHNCRCDMCGCMIRYEGCDFCRVRAPPHDQLRSVGQRVVNVLQMWFACHRLAKRQLFSSGWFCYGNLQCVIAVLSAWHA